MRVRGSLALIAALGAAAASAPAAAADVSCVDVTQANADFEAYGPTDVNVQAGNGRVTVNENAAGTLTVFKYPNPSLFNQVKYFSVRRDARGRVIVQHPNEGSFAGVRYTTRAGVRGFAWLRDWRSDQRYDSPDTPMPVTTYRSPPRLGLRVTNVDLAPPGRARFVREYWVSRSRRSPVRRASLVYFENFNPTASHVPLVPLSDWCFIADTDRRAVFESRSDAIVNSWHGIDAATGRRASIAVAFGFAGRAAAHQVGEDGYDENARPGGPPDPYDQLTKPPHRLGGADAAEGQTSGALEQRLRFDRDGHAEARMTIAGGRDAPDALEALDAGRRLGFHAQWAAVRRDWHRFLRGRRLPAGRDARVTNVAKRSLITVRLARAAGTGAIVASANTQGPYGEDWIRDGAFINQMLDVNGLTRWVTQHNRFYVRVQASPEHPSARRPPGNWPMASYADGIDGAPIDWEIDETGLGIWTLYDHFHHLHGRAARGYLAHIYPAIVRAADFLTLCEDPANGFQCLANEDDSYVQTQSLHGAETVYLGLRSAIAAATVRGDRTPRAKRWKRRLGRLRAAIAGLYDRSRRLYRPGHSAGNPYTNLYGDGGWLLWPVHFKPYDDPTMVGEAQAVYRSMNKSLAAARGQYEAKALLGLAHAWRPLRGARRRALKRVLRFMARTLTTRTGLLGESWERLASGRTIAVQDQPHVWEHALFYLSALQIEGGRGYRFAGGGFVAGACARGIAPRAACPGRAARAR
jgi:hypothetical protein